jgi:hypothetical protein
LAFAHAAGVSISQAGSGGCLAEVILDASADAENYCMQGSDATDHSLFALSRTERWEMPSTRAFLTNDLTLSIRTGHFPVQSISALSVDIGLGQTLTLDATHAELPSGGRVVELPYIMTNALTPGLEFLLDRFGPYGFDRSGPYWANVTYIGGFNAGAVPYDFQRAVVLMVSDLLSQRQNPTGASEIGLGKRKLVQRQRGDLVGDSLLLLRAHDLLDNYAQGQF